MRGTASRIHIRQVDLHMVLFATRPGAARIEGMARYGQHPPPGDAEAFDGGMTDAAAGAGQQQDGLIGTGHDNVSFTGRLAS
jgi:hypothetical protein